MPKVQTLHANIRFLAHTCFHFHPLPTCTQITESGAILGQSIVVFISFAETASTRNFHLFFPLLLFYLFPLFRIVSRAGFWRCQFDARKNTPILRVKLAKRPHRRKMGGGRSVGKRDLPTPNLWLSLVWRGGREGTQVIINLICKCFSLEPLQMIITLLASWGLRKQNFIFWLRMPE